MKRKDGFRKRERQRTSRKRKWRGDHRLAGLILSQHRVGRGLSLGGVRGCDRVNDGLRFLVADFCSGLRLEMTAKRQWMWVEELTLIVVHDIAEVVSPAVMCLSHAHRVMREVDIAVIAWERGN